jgi:hypothetical protein
MCTLPPPKGFVPRGRVFCVKGRENMILKWNGDGPLSISPIDVEPYKTAWAIKDLREKEAIIKRLQSPVKNVVLVPGWNEVEDNTWFLCRAHVVDKIDSGKIEELVREEKGEDGEKKFVGVTISDFKNRQGAILNPEYLVKIIRGCFVVKTLEKWKALESRDEIRLEIVNQIDKLNKPEEE